jgi:hypothetical protein
MNEICRSGPRHRSASPCHGLSHGVDDPGHIQRDNDHDHDHRQDQDHRPDPGRLRQRPDPGRRAFASQKLGGVVGCNASGRQAGDRRRRRRPAGRRRRQQDRWPRATAARAPPSAPWSARAPVPTVGCKMQKSDAAKATSAASTSRRHPLRSSRSSRAADVKIKTSTSPARPEPARGRLDPRRQAGRVGAGQTFQALGRTGDGKWILVGQDGVGVGYVSQRLRLPGLTRPI